MDLSCEQDAFVKGNYEQYERSCERVLKYRIHTEPLDVVFPDNSIGGSSKASILKVC